MKKTILLLGICLCTLNTFSQTIIVPETFEKSLARKKSWTISEAKREAIKLLNTAAADNFDSDGDGVFDDIDIDDDNDRILDVVEAGFGYLSEGRGTLTSCMNWVDVNGNSMRDSTEGITPFDTNTDVFGLQSDLEGKLSLYFDGINDYIEEDNGTNVVNGLAEATMMAWVKLDPNFSSNGAIMGQKNLWIRINTSKRLRVEIQDYYSLTAPQLITLNKWVHVAVVYKGTDAAETLKLYINGEKVAVKNDLTIQGGIQTDANNKFRIGRTPTSESFSTGEMFKGEIDEVRVFNKALTDDELQKMVYQELDEISGFNSGTVIPRAISPTIGDNLVRYFRMDVYKGDIIDDLTTPTIDVGSGAKMYNIENIYPQTAPLPYETKADGDWSNTATWLHGGVWDIASESTNKDWAIVRVKNNLTTSNSHTLAGLIVDSGKKLSVKTSKELKNTWYLELDGAIDLEDESQLVQTENSMLDQDSGGYIERDQQGTANSFNYNYWSSSVGAITPLGLNQKGSGVANINSNHKLVDVLFDGTGADGTGGALPYPKEINFQPAYWAADSGITTPIIISSYWLHTFNGTDNNYGAWKSINENALLNAGEGYTMKGTSGSVPIASQQNYVFKGKPNNGDFTLQIDAGNSRLIGNPYPSAMDADEFIKDNIKETINSKAGRNTEGNIFNGALYFWDHFGEKNSHYLKDYVGGYATYTLMGGAKAIASDTRINTTSGLLSSKIPQQYISVNQAFFVTAALVGLTGTTPTINGGKIVFENSQRIFKTEAKDDSVFMKGVGEKSANSSVEKAFDTIANVENIDKRPKIWLQFDSPTGYRRQLLVGVDENASNFFDLGYDAPIADIGKEDMFWTFDGGKFVIQAVNNFNSDQELPFGMKVSKTGLARIKIEEQQHMDENISVHIKDKLTGEMHNISRKSFEINLEAGTYLERFSLIFKMHKLVEEDVNAEIFHAVESPPIIEGIHIFMDNTIGELQIKNNYSEEITSIILYNYLGQTIKTWNNNLNRRTISLPIHIASGVYVAKTNTKNKIVVRKIVIQ